MSSNFSSKLALTPGEIWSLPNSQERFFRTSRKKKKNPSKLQMLSFWDVSGQDHKSCKWENIMMFKPGLSQNWPNKFLSLCMIAFGDRNFTKVTKVKNDQPRIHYTSFLHNKMKVGTYRETPEEGLVGQGEKLSKHRVQKKLWILGID